MCLSFIEDGKAQEVMYQQRSHSRVHTQVCLTLQARRLPTTLHSLEKELHMKNELWRRLPLPCPQRAARWGWGNCGVRSGPQRRAREAGCKDVPPCLCSPTDTHPTSQTGTAFLCTFANGNPSRGLCDFYGFSNTPLTISKMISIIVKQRNAPCMKTSLHTHQDGCHKKDR